MLFALLALTGLLSAGCGGTTDTGSNAGDGDPHTVEIARDAFAGEWPFTVDSGTLRCEPITDELGAVTFDTGGETYAVNGTAKSRGDGASLDDIWAASEDGDGLQKDMTDVIDAGLALCD